MKFSSSFIATAIVCLQVTANAKELLNKKVAKPSVERIAEVQERIARESVWVKERKDTTMMKSSDFSAAATADWGILQGECNPLCSSYSYTETCFAGDSTYGACRRCGLGTAANYSAANDCMSCGDGYEIQAVYDDCTGYCVPEGTSSSPLGTFTCESHCASCGFTYHGFANDDCDSSRCDSATSSTCAGSCLTCGFDTYDADDCLTCPAGEEVDVVYDDCTGRCVANGTATTSILKSGCLMPCSDCGNEYDGLAYPRVLKSASDDDEFCFHIDTKVDYKGVEYTHEELKAGKEPECTVPHSPFSKGVIISTSCDKTVRVTDTHLMATTKGFQLAYSLKAGDVLFGDYNKELCTVKSVEKEKTTQQYFGLNCVHSEVLASGLRASTFGDFHTLPSWYMTYVGGLVGSETASSLGEYIAEWYFQK